MSLPQLIQAKYSMSQVIVNYTIYHTALYSILHFETEHNPYSPQVDVRQDCLYNWFNETRIDMW